MKTPEEAMMDNVKKQADALFDKHFKKSPWPIGEHQARLLYRHAFISGLHSSMKKIEEDDRKMEMNRAIFEGVQELRNQG